MGPNSLMVVYVDPLGLGFRVPRHALSFLGSLPNEWSSMSVIYQRTRIVGNTVWVHEL